VDLQLGRSKQEVYQADDLGGLDCHKLDGVGLFRHGLPKRAFKVVAKTFFSEKKKMTHGCTPKA